VIGRLVGLPDIADRLDSTSPISAAGSEGRRNTCAITSEWLTIHPSSGVVNLMSGACISMRIRVYSQRFALAFLILFLPSRGLAMDLPHYELDSLVYLSTDIVVADLAKDTHGNFTATVTEVLYGSLHAGEKLDALSPFLMFFQPLNDGQKVILFLDHRPRQYDFTHQDAAKSPFAVPPSGVYLIDEYGHVHEYFQQNNPGPYVAQGYMFSPEHTIPTEKEDLALPSLDEVKAGIAAAIKSVIPIRNFLDHATTAADRLALMKLLASRPRFPETCSVGRYDAIASDIIDKIRLSNDPELLLSTWHLDGGELSALPFVQVGGNRQKDFTDTRVNYLIRTLSDRKKDISLRLASLEILLDISRFHSGPQTGPSRSLPIDDEWLAPSADQIIATSKAIFEDPVEDSQLRALSLGFLDLRNPRNVADIQRAYKKTRSPQLHFAIEQAFLDVSDELYQSLHSPSGPVASIVQLAPEHGCAQPPDNQITFVNRFYSTRAFNARGSVVTAGRIVLKNTKSGQSYEAKNVRSIGGQYGTLDGVLLFRLDQLSDFPLGVYTLGMEYAHQFNVLYSPYDDVPSIGHTITIAITDSPNGKSLSIPPGDKEKNQRNPAAERELSQYISDESPYTPTAMRGNPKFKVVYTVTGLTFPGAGPQHTETFQFTAPNFITSRINLSASQLDSCANCIQSGTSVQFFPKGTLPLVVPADSVHFTDADGMIYGWYFAPGAFSAEGTYTALNSPPYIVSDVATMTVRAVRARPKTTSK
jgi:hypothetical protein